MLTISNITSSLSAQKYYSSGDYYVSNNKTEEQLKNKGEQNNELFYNSNSDNKESISHDKEFNNQNSNNSLNNNLSLNYQESLNSHNNNIPLNQWYGKGAKELNLTEKEFDPKNFKDLLEGKIITNINGKYQEIQLGKKNKDGTLDHACGIDATFAPPKSVSILAEIGGDKDIVKAHDEAVNKTLDLIERELSATRVKTNNQIDIEKTDNLIIAKFLHNTNRELDPHIHTHCTIMNIVKKDNGDYRSAYLKEIFNNKMNLGAIYRMELAHNLKQLGYQIDHKDKDAIFEIKGVSDEMIKAFSNRRQQIEEKLKELEKNDIHHENNSNANSNTKNISAKSKQLANFLTRNKKIDIANKDLQEFWHDSIKEKDLSLESLQKVISERKELNQNHQNKNNQT
ncbi:relaxase domain-containing protein [Flavobacteriaceae bacterium]|nr:relaxase domain-containing protein [Flavobacteriaceae bacterium]